jgi:hypothetical protein
VVTIALAAGKILAMATDTERGLHRRHLSYEQFEEAFEREARREMKRRKQLRRRAANRSRARRIARTERSGKVRFSVLAISLTLTTVVVVVVMFEVLAWLVGG